MTNQKMVVQVDLNRTKETVNVGARRATAFLTICRSRAEPEALKSFSIGGLHKYSFWPEPLPIEGAKNAVKEFDAWAVGACLRELHVFFEQFLNEVKSILEILEKNGNMVPPGFGLSKQFESIPSVAKKQQIVCEALDVDDSSKHFKSLHLARNSLNHGTGAVRERDCNKDDPKELKVSWQKFQTFFWDEGEKVVLNDLEEPYQVKAAGGVHVQIEAVEAERTFALKAPVRFEDRELAEITLFYLGSADRILTALQEKI